MILIFAKIVGGFLLLYFGGEQLVTNSVKIATKFNVPKLLIGLTIVAVGTSAPELLVSVTSALKGLPVVAIGNVIGSNITNIGLILGVSALILPIKVEKKTITFDGPFMLFTVFLLVLFSWDGKIVFWEGLLLFSTFIIYILIEKKISTPEDSENSNVEVKTKTSFLILLIILSLFGLAFGANIFVDGAIELAHKLKISEKIIALTMVAVGTSLPEFITSVIATFKKENEIVIGNIIGSNIFNIIIILGITAMVKKLDFNLSVYFNDIIWMLIFTLLVLVAFLPLRTSKISRIEGLIILGFYIVYILTLMQ